MSELKNSATVNVQFSVVIPVYNKEIHVARAIMSVLTQRYEEFELIIVCDPSTDKSNAEVEKFSDPRIKIYYRDNPGPGGYAARNLGISKAVNEWIAFLDADDEWYPNHLFRMNSLIEQFPDTKVFSSARHSSTHGNIAPDNFYKAQIEKEIRKITFNEYLNYCFKGERAIGTNSIIINKDMIDDNFFPIDRTKRSGDLYAWIKLLAKAKWLVWSPHFACLGYRDVEGVSSSAIPNIKLNNEMVDELKGKISLKEQKSLKKYANRLIITAYLENKRLKGKVNGSLLKKFYWTATPWYCVKWFFIASLPYSIFSSIISIKQYFKK